MSSKTELAVQQPSTVGTGLFENAALFGAAYEMAEKLAKSSLLPKEYRDKPENVFVALEIAKRRGISPLAVMQNLNVIQGRPSWSSAYILTVVNISGLYTSPLRFDIKDEGEKECEYEYYDNSGAKRSVKVKVKNLTCRAQAVERSTGESITGPTVSMEMAVKEGWYTKSGSKWKTMPELMLRYRAAAFFVRSNCPEVIEGLHTADEVEDIIDAPPVTVRRLVEPAPAASGSGIPLYGGVDSGKRSFPEDGVVVPNPASAPLSPTLAKPRKKKAADAPAPSLGAPASLPASGSGSGSGSDSGIPLYGGVDSGKQSFPEDGVVVPNPASVLNTPDPSGFDFGE
jgi:hypothetical protein